MLLTDKKINHINAVAHDGKVVCFGTDPDGVVWYTVKRSGFEDTALTAGADPFGFEGWQQLRLGASVADPSVTANEQKTLADAAGNVLVRSVYGNAAEATKSIDAPVQVLSSMNLLYVFRQAPSGKILVNRFVLDGMTNELVPKLEVRFRRSRQRLEPQKSAASKAGGSFDNLDYRDIDGNPFYEPATELGFAGTVANGWFSPLVVPTVESDRNRWHLFVVDAAASKVVLYTVGSGDDGLFDVKDYLYGRQDPTDPENTVYRSIPGIVCRTIELSGLTVAAGLSATTYDLQKEQMTDTGPRLMRDAMRVMLAVPVKASGSDVVKTAAVDFALATDGTLSRIDPTPDTSVILRSSTREVITPLALFDGIKEIANASPPPAGTIAATERGAGDQLQVRSKEPLPADLAAGSRVKIRGTQSYDGHYKVLSVAGTTFQVAATFESNEAGFWEVAPARQTRLVFDNMVVGSEKTADGKLKILCPAHDLKVGDEVQISGSRQYDGIFPIASVVADKNGFVLDAPFFTGEAANLSKVIRRGLRMDGNDSVETPELELAPPSPERDMGRTLSAWVRVDAAGNLEQSLVKDSGGMMNLALGSDNKVKLGVRMSDGATRTVTDPTAMPVNAWVHYAGTVDYVTATGGNTRIALVRDGVEVAQQAVPYALPCHLNDQTIVFDGVDDYVDVPAGTASFTAGITVEAWVYLETPAEASTERAIFAEKRPGTDDVQFTIKLNDADHKLEAGFYVQGASWFTAKMAAGLPQKRWIHVAATYDGHFVCVYVDGTLAVQSADFNRALPAVTHGWHIGRRHDNAAAGSLWKGRIADVRLWTRARTQPEIAQQLVTRLSGREVGLAGYWPLDSGTTRDLSPAKRHGTLNGNAAWTKAAYLYPQITPPAAPGAKLARAMKFDGAADHIEVSNAAALFTGSFTVAAWVKVTGGKGTHRSPITCRGAGTTGFMFYATDTNQWSCWIGNGTAWINSPTVAVVEGTWVHLAATYSGTTLTFYVNGISQGTVTGAYQAPNRSMRIGAGNTEGAPQYHFNGLIADVQIWSVARAQADIQAGMSSRLAGTESGLAGYWPLDRGAGDLSPNLRNGALKGNPALVNVGSVHTIGQAFSGEIAEVQIWGEARAAADVKATMHLNPSGKENGLAAYYRMGAIVYEEPAPIVPDFSHHGKNGVVIGDPYAGARRLNRATGSGMKVVKYGSEELVAVSQRGVYEESFEFRLTTTDPAFNPSNADGTGLRLFVFSYWGKSSRGSKEVKAFPAGSVQQSDFSSLGGGWYKATCRVVVPDGISLMRAFEISDVRGKWGAEAAPPAIEWTAIDVRKHRIRLVSDAVTRDSYTDVTALASLPAQSQAVLDNLMVMGRAEARVGRVELQVRDLAERIDVVKNNERYRREKAALEAKVPGLQSTRAVMQSQRDAIPKQRFSYYQALTNGNSGKLLTAGDDRIVRQYGPWAASDQDCQRWVFEDRGGGLSYNIRRKRGGLALTVPGAGGQDTDLTVADPSGVAHQQWSIMASEIYSGLPDHLVVALGPKHAGGQCAEAAREGTGDGVAVQLWPWSGGNHQKWVAYKTADLTAEATAAIRALETLINDLGAEILTAQNRITRLAELLGNSETLASLQSQLATAQTNLSAARTDLAAKNTPVIAGILQAPPATMPAIATDDRDLVTAGAVLDFAQPTGRIRLAESCDGNVLLTYFDPQGRMRATCYDAAADSRNATFEQWLPDAVRACADVRDSGDKITLAQAVSLPADGWTCEAWVQYPLATKGDGTAYDTNLVAAAEGKLDVPLAARKGSRLGLMVDGWFFDSGADLEPALAAGWHHVAAATSKGTTSFYADGAKLGSRPTSQPALRFNGTAAYVEVPAHANPTAAITVSVWARSATPSWNGTGFLVSKRDAFVMHPAAGSRTIQFFVWISGMGWKCAEYTPADIQGWHMYTGTFDGNYLSLYIDGEAVAELAVAGAVQAAPGVMYIGYDNANNAYFNGDIAEVAVWSAARSLSDVRSDLYKTFKGNEAGLFGYWRMAMTSEAGGSKVNDLTTNGRHGVVKGTPADVTISTQRVVDIKVLGNAPGGGSPVGRLAEVRLWNLGLTDAEVAAHANVSLSGNEPGLIGYWPFDEATGVTAFDRSADGQAHAAMVGVDWVGRTANIGNPGSKALNLPDRGSAYVQCPAVALAGKSFTFECWARRSGAGAGLGQFIAHIGTAAVNSAFHFGFRDTGKLTLGFYGNDVDTPTAYTDTDWHHWCGTYDQPTKKQRIYCDGVLIVERTATSDFVGSGALNIGRNFTGGDYFTGDLAEVRIWDKARTEAEIRATMRRRAAGNEPNLLACYPMDEVSPENRVRERKLGSFQGQLNGSARLLLSTSLPTAGAESLIIAEYSSVEVSGEGRKQALMKRFYGFTSGADVHLLPEQRLEELTLQWVGNTQINPTLLGYVEGAPPVPSENLTEATDDGYAGATTVTLKQSDETAYSWQRSETDTRKFNTEGFIGVGWEVAASTGLGVEIQHKATEGKLGGSFTYEHVHTDTKDTTITATSTLSTTDSLALSGMFEDKAACPAVGKRWLPKNVGYALVISGMADVFITKLKRSGRMVSYDIRPVDGVPLDVNTITFMLNPAYTLNGSLDGMVGSMPADPTFYPHVPDMRSQYGSLYPASYFRLKEAYALKATIDRQDKERESFFYNFHASAIEPSSAIGASGEPVAPSMSQASEPTTDKSGKANTAALKAQNERMKEESKAEAEKRKAEIEAKHKTIEAKLRAAAAFSDWQVRMENIQTRAGKRNIVNTYVWDGDGGLRAEEQSFASTIEHSISSSDDNNGGMGAVTDALYGNFKFELSLVGSGGEAIATSKKLNTSKSLELTVDLSGVEKTGITDLKDHPLVPGEKVDRYRFMTFYLEGSTDHFNDFFSYVVDPEWLISNDEEARALRMARGAKPNKTWRVLHRVTYVERPVLMALNKK